MSGRVYKAAWRLEEQEINFDAAYTLDTQVADLVDNEVCADGFSGTR